MNAGTIQFYATIFAFICLAFVTVIAADDYDKCVAKGYSSDTCFHTLNR